MKACSHVPIISQCMIMDDGCLEDDVTWFTPDFASHVSTQLRQASDVDMPSTGTSARSQGAYMIRRGSFISLTAPRGG